MEMKDIKAISIPEGSVKKIEDSNGNILWGSPDAFPYRRLEYLHFNGAEYIEEDFGLHGKQRRMILDFDTEVTTNNKTLLGQYDGSVVDARRRLYCIRIGSNGTVIQSSVGNTFGGNFSYSTGTKYRSDVTYTNASAPTLDIKVYKDSTTLVNTTITQTGQTSVGTIDTKGTIGCQRSKRSDGTINREGFWVGKLYFFQKYNTSTSPATLQNTQYPAQRKSDGVCGMFDVSNRKFYPMSGTTITDGAAGPVVDEYWDLTAPS